MGPEGAGPYWTAKSDGRGVVCKGGAVHGAGPKLQRPEGGRAPGPAPPAAQVCGWPTFWYAAFLQAPASRLLGLLPVEPVLPELNCLSRTLLANVPYLTLFRTSRNS